MKVVVNNYYSQSFSKKVINWFKDKGVILPPRCDETFFERHNPLLVQAVQELEELNYLEVKETQGNIYRIQYDYDQGCEYVEEPKDDFLTWICVGDEDTMVFKENHETCSSDKCIYTTDEDDEGNKISIPFNPRWCVHCSNNPTAHFLQMKEVKKDVNQVQEEFNKLIIETAERIEKE